MAASLSLHSFVALWVAQGVPNGIPTTVDSVEFTVNYVKTTAPSAESLKVKKNRYSRASELAQGKNGVRSRTTASASQAEASTIVLMAQEFKTSTNKIEVDIRHAYYPKESLRLREEGTVEIHTSIDSTGSVSQLQWGEMSEYQRLNRAAVEILRSIKIKGAISHPLTQSFVFKFNIDSKDL